MKRTNNNIILFIVAFCFLSNFSLFSQTLIQSDFEKLVNDHPLMKRHDSKTGFFKNTAYDRSFDQDYLRAENASLTLELEKIQRQRKAYEEKMLSDNESEDSLWNNIAELDNKKNEIEKKIEKNTQLAFNYSDGDIFDGEWNNDMKEGKGKLTYKNGTIFEGTWKGDKRDGEGVFKNAILNVEYNDGVLTKMKVLK